MTTYTHQYFGSGYKILERTADDWCSLEKKSDDGSINWCSDYFSNLTEDDQKE